MYVGGSNRDSVVRKTKKFEAHNVLLLDNKTKERLWKVDVRARIPMYFSFARNTRIYKIDEKFSFYKKVEVEVGGGKKEVNWDLISWLPIDKSWNIKREVSGIWEIITITWEVSNISGLRPPQAVPPSNAEQGGPQSLNSSSRSETPIESRQSNNQKVVEGQDKGVEQKKAEPLLDRSIIYGHQWIENGINSHVMPFTIMKAAVMTTRSKRAGPLNVLPEVPFKKRIQDRERHLCLDTTVFKSYTKLPIEIYKNYVGKIGKPLRSHSVISWNRPKPQSQPEAVGVAEQKAPIEGGMKMEESKPTKSTELHLIYNIRDRTRGEVKGTLPLTEKINLLWLDFSPTNYSDTTLVNILFALSYSGYYNGINRNKLWDNNLPIPKEFVEPTIKALENNLEVEWEIPKELGHFQFDVVDRLIIIKYQGNIVGELLISERIWYVDKTNKVLFNRYIGFVTPAMNILGLLKLKYKLIILSKAYKLSQFDIYLLNKRNWTK